MHVCSDVVYFYLSLLYMYAPYYISPLVNLWVNNIYKVSPDLRQTFQNKMLCTDLM